MKLPFRCVPYARHWARFHSVRGALALVAFAVVQASAAAALGAILPAWITGIIVIVLAVFIGVGSVHDQGFDKDAQPPTVPRPLNAGKSTQ